MRIAVAGGTGTLGALVVAEVQRLGYQPVILARARGVNLVTGVGVSEALQGCQAVIDCSNQVTMSRRTAVRFFSHVTSNLLFAEREAGVAHHVAISIVGVDRVSYPYYTGKLTQERLLAASEQPYTVLRTTQFHEFAGQMLGQIPGPVAVLPRMLIQPVAASEVAGLLVSLAVGEPAGGPEQGGPQLAGPAVHEVTDLARQLLEATGTSRRVLGMTLPTRWGKAMAAGGLLPVPGTPLGSLTFAQWLQQRAR